MPGSIKALMAPRNVVLVGASDRNWSVRVWRNLTRFGFSGRVFPVNPNRTEIWGLRCYSALADLPEAPDHLALFIPNEQMLNILDEGGRLGARSATLYPSGFGEGGDESGRQRARRLLRILETHDIAAIGPNCMGLAVGHSKFCTFPDEQVEALTAGPVAALTQSGTLAQTFCRGLFDVGLTLSHLISCGNQAGLTLADFIDHLADEPDLKVIACYIESVLDGPRFLTAARKARDNGKTLVVVKAGASQKAREATLAHTGSLAGSTKAFDVFAAEAGIVRVDSLEDMVEAAVYFCHLPRPSGPGICVMTNSGAIKSLTIDAAELLGGILTSLAPSTAARLHEIISDAELSNPFDTKRTLPTHEYISCVKALHDDPNVDLLLLVEEAPREAGIERKERNMKALNEWIGTQALKPVVVCSPLTLRETPYMLNLRAQLAHIPFLRDLGKTLRTISRIAAPPGSPARSGLAIADERTKLVRTWRARAASLRGPTALSKTDSKELLAAYGLRLPPEEVVKTTKEALDAANRIGFPIVLKAVCATIAHKSDAGMVILDIRDKDAIVVAATELKARCASLGVRLEGMLVAKQMTDGVEMAIGMHRDPEMGPVIMVALGGVWLELFKDAAFAPPWLDEDEARRAIATTRAARALAGYRGAPERDLAALARAMVALGRLVGELGDAVEAVDVNPLLVLSRGEGAVALDGLVVLRPPGPDVPERHAT